MLLNELSYNALNVILNHNKNDAVDILKRYHKKRKDKNYEIRNLKDYLFLLFCAIF